MKGRSQVVATQGIRFGGFVKIKSALLPAAVKGLDMCGHQCGRESQKSQDLCICFSTWIQDGSSLCCCCVPFTTRNHCHTPCPLPATSRGRLRSPEIQLLCCHAFVCTFCKEGHSTNSSHHAVQKVTFHGHRFKHRHCSPTL